MDVPVYEARDALRAATAARDGGSNDDEIDALWWCANLLAQIVGIDTPEED